VRGVCVGVVMCVGVCEWMGIGMCVLLCVSVYLC